MQANPLKTQGHLPKQVEDWLLHLKMVRDYSGLTIGAYRTDLGQLAEFLGERGMPADITSLEPAALYQWAAYLGERYAPATVRRKLDAVSSLMTHLRNLGFITSNPLATVPRPRRKRKIPTPPTVTECKRLLAACQTSRERAVMGLLVFCGLRKSELIGLDRIDLAADLTQLTVRHAKGGDQRLVPICQKAQAILREYLDEQPQTDGPLIRSKVDTRMGSTSFQRLFKRIVRRAALAERGLTIHCLRHAFATQLAKAGVDIGCIQQLMGHRDIATTAQYLHSDRATQNNAVERLAAMFTATSADVTAGPGVQADYETDEEVDQ